MTDLVNDLKAAKALIDTEGKFSVMPFGVLSALMDVTPDDDEARFEAAQDAMLEFGSLNDINRLPHADIMSLFDRAIAAAEARS